MGRKQLERKIQELMGRQQAIHDKAKNDGSRSLTLDEEVQFNDLQKEIDIYNGLLKELEVDPVPFTSTYKADGQKELEIERQRCSEITSLCREFNIDNVDQYIREGKTLDEVRGIILDSLKQSNTPISTKVTKDEGDKVRTAAIDALLMRGGIEVEKPAEGAKDIMGMSLRNLFGECMQREGNAANFLRMSDDEMFAEMQRQFFNPSSAFPSIMDATIKKAYVTMYEQTPTTYQDWVSFGTLADFKATPDHNYIAGSAGRFMKVPENGELVHDKPSDILLPNRKLETFGRQFTMSRQAVINDDIGFLTTVPGRYAQAAKETINDQVYEILFNNPVIYDGTVLFSSEHRNLIGAGTQFSEQALETIILQLGKQINQEGRSIRLRPGAIIVPLGLGFAVQKLFASQTLDANGTANPFYGQKMQIVEEPLLNQLAGETAVPWFLAANKTSAKSIQVDFLNGNQTPIIQRSTVPGILGFVWDIFLDWGVNVVDYRGLVKNPGIKMV